MKSWSPFTSATALVALLALLAGGCSTLDEQQREWIFQPSDRSWGNSEAMSQGMDDVWVDFNSSLTGEPVRLHGLWLGSPPESANTPVMLSLHGARYNVYGAPRGDLRLRREISRRAMRIGHALSPDDVVITNGCTEAATLALTSVAKPGDTIAVESPTYFGLLHTLEVLGLKALELPTDPTRGVNVDALARLLDTEPVAA